MISGAALNPKNAKETSTSPARINLPSFPLSFRFVTFMDINGILVTINPDEIRASKIIARGEPINELKMVE